LHAEQEVLRINQLADCQVTQQMVVQGLVISVLETSDERVKFLIGDSRREMLVVQWGNRPAPAERTVIRCRATVTRYSGDRQLTVSARNKIELVPDADIADYAPATEEEEREPIF